MGGFHQGGHGVVRVGCERREDAGDVQYAHAVEVDAVHDVRRGARCGRTRAEVDDLRLTVAGTDFELVSGRGVGGAADVGRVDVDAVHVIEDEIALPVLAECGHVADGMPLAGDADRHVEFGPGHLAGECACFEIGFVRIDDEVHHGFADGHDFGHCCSLR